VTSVLTNILDARRLTLVAGRDVLIVLRQQYGVGLSNSTRGNAEPQFPGLTSTTRDPGSVSITWLRPGADGLPSSRRRHRQLVESSRQRPSCAR
jgi:hypothetical protein